MTLRGRRPLIAARARGAALIMLMALLTMGVLYFLTVQLEAVSLYQREAQRGGGSSSVGQAREALLGHATTYRDNNANEVFGYLPCPDTTGDGVADTVLNTAECGSSGQASIGLLPYRTLGLPDLRDADGNCLWYAVSGSFKAALTKPTPMNWDTQGQFSVVDGNAASLVAPDDSQGGAAAVIFSAGAPLASQSRTASASGPCQIDPSQVSAYLDGSYSFATSNTIPLTQGPVKDANGGVTNNDRLAWITPKEIFDRVIKRQDFSNALTASPAGQINTLIDRLVKAVEKKIQDDIFNATSTSLPSNIASYTPQPASAAMGDVDAATDISLTNATSYANYLTNWSDQFRQIRCSSVSTACLDINNSGTANCRGALLFSGRTSTGQPRTGAQKTASMANLDNYFEAAASALLKGTSTSFTGSIAYTGSTPSADVAACLGYGSFVSLRQDAAAFLAGTITPGGTATAVATVTGVGTATPAIVLGNTNAASRAGCVWNPTALPLASSLRLYFKYRIDSATTGSTARGYTLTLADAATNSPYRTDPLMCGTSGTTRLGYAGAPGSGTAMVGASTFAISGTSWSPSTLRATITTATAHSFIVGDSVTIAGASPTGYNGGPYTIVTVGGSSTNFSYSVAYPGPARAGIAPPKIGVEFDTNVDSSRNDPSAEHFAFLYWGSAGDNNMASASTTRDGSDDNSHGDGVAGDGSQPLNPRSLSTTSATATAVAGIAAAQWAGGTATITTSAAHGFPNNQRIIISDTSPLGYKGTYTATVTDATHFTYPLATAPGAYPHAATVAAATWAGGTTTVTTSAAHGLSTGSSVIVSNTSPSTWNGTCVMTVIDATHFSCALASNPGSYVSGGQVSYPLGWVNAASWSGGIVTVTTSSAHNLVSNQYVTITGILPSGYNGTYRITVTDATHFAYALTNPATNPGAYASGGQVAITGIASTVMAATSTNISGASWSSSGNGAATITTAAAHGLAIGQTVYVDAIVSAGPASYNGVYAVASVPSSTRITYGRAIDPGSYTSGGRVAIAAPASSTISSAAWSSTNGGTATLATAAAHGLATGQVVHIAGISPGGYNGAYAVTVIDATHLSYALTSDPGGSFAATSFATPGIATVKSADPYFPYNGAMPTDTDIHVRVDIGRSYDASRRQATLTLKAYVGDTFALIGNCGQADFQNFARDLSELCPIRTPTIEQDGITVNDVAGPALANIYLGFTTGRGASVNDNETINITNLILRSQ